MTCKRPGGGGSLWLDRIERELVCLLCARRTPLVSREQRIEKMVAVYRSDTLEAQEVQS